MENKISLVFECYELLANHTYKGNYRELENILASAILSARINNRTEILPEDLCILQEELQGGTQRIDSAPSAPFIEWNETENIKLEDIVTFAEQRGAALTAAIAEQKVREILEAGKNIKFTMMKEEGLTKKEYARFYSRFRDITRKGIRDIRKSIETDRK